MAKIWIVEDDPKISLLIEMTVRKMEHETLRMADATELEKNMKKEPLPDLVLLDLMLRGKSGYDILTSWKADLRTRNIPVIILSARSAEHDKVRGLELGAEDYITKPFGVRELQARIRTALRRIPSEPERIRAGKLELVVPTREVFLEGKRVEITQREFELLLYLVRRAGTTVTRTALLADVWGYAAETDTSRTVDSHIKTLRMKLQDDPSDPKIIRTVRGTGYRFIAEEEA